MAFKISPQKYSGSVRPMAIGSGEKAFTVGGDTAYPFFTFEGKMPNAPRIGLQVLDYAPDDWAEACVEPYKDVINDPVAWAKKAQNEYGADFIQLWLKSTDPNGLNRRALDAAQTAKGVADELACQLAEFFLECDVRQGTRPPAYPTKPRSAMRRSTRPSSRARSR